MGSLRRVVTRIPAVAALVAGALAAPWAAAQEIYRLVDAEGAVSFTDFPVAGAHPVSLCALGDCGRARDDRQHSPRATDAERALASQRLIDQQLTVARALEESRLARAGARAELLRAHAASEPQVVVYEVPTRYSGGWGLSNRRYRRQVHHSSPRRGYGRDPGRPHQPIVPERPSRPGRGGHSGATTLSKPMWMGR